MRSQPRFCAVILAAGASSRMGREKALLPWPPGSPSGGTLLSAAIAALKPFVQATVVVAGKNADTLAPFVEKHGASLVRNLQPDRGQFSSIQIGLRAALEHGCDAAMLTPVDCPPLGAASLERLCAVFASAQARGAWAVAPEHNRLHGHPLIAGLALIEAFLRATAASNAREVKRAHSDKFEYVDVVDPLLAVDLNTPEQYSALAAKPASC